MAWQLYIQKSTWGHVEHPRLHIWTDFWSNKRMPDTIQPFTIVSHKLYSGIQWPAAPPLEEVHT